MEKKILIFNRLSHILKELKEHVGFTTFSVAIGIGVLVLFRSLVGEEGIADRAYDLFHFFHPLHLFFSITATTSMVYRHSRKIISPIIIGVIGSVSICGISDIFLPFLSGILLGSKMKLHVCIVEHIGYVSVFIVFGSVIGLLLPPKSVTTIFTHSLHVLISSAASLLYLISFGLIYWHKILGAIFVYIVLSVLIPCCTSDIVFPLLFVESEKRF